MLYRTPVGPAYDKHGNLGYDNTDKQKSPGHIVTLPIWEAYEFLPPQNIIFNSWIIIFINSVFKF